MNYGLNMKVYCIPASQITSPCFPISSHAARQTIDKPPKVPGALFSLAATINFSPGLKGLLATSRLTGGWHEVILAHWAKEVQIFTLLCLSAAFFS